MKYNFVQNGRGHLIYDLELVYGYALRSELKSVRKLTVLPRSVLSSNLALLPNVEEVTLGSLAAPDPNTFQSLLAIKNLRKLSLHDFCCGRTCQGDPIRNRPLFLIQRLLDSCLVCSSASGPKR